MSPALYPACHAALHETQLEPVKRAGYAMDSFGICSKAWPPDALDPGHHGYESSNSVGTPWQASHESMQGFANLHTLCSHQVQQTNTSASGQTHNEWQ